MSEKVGNRTLKNRSPFRFSWTQSTLQCFNDLFQLPLSSELAKSLINQLLLFITLSYDRDILTLQCRQIGNLVVVPGKDNLQSLPTFV